MILQLGLLCTSLSAQYFNFESLTTREGLSQNGVNTIFQDSRGFLWIGTDDGLNRYDGYNCKVYRVDPLRKGGISSNLIYIIAEDLDGNLWLGTSDEGVCKFDVQKEQFVPVRNEDGKPNILQSNKINNIVPTNDGKIWVGTSKGIDVVTQKDGVYDIEHIPFSYLSDKEVYDITSMQVDNYGRIWVGTLKGLYVIFNANNQRKVVTVDDSACIRRICVINDEVYVAYLSSIHKFWFNWEDLSNKQHVKLADISARSLLKDAKGNLYAGTSEGLYLFEKNRKSGTAYDNPILLNKDNGALMLNTKITSLCNDRYGNIWMGTNGGGVYKYNKSQKKFRHYKKTDEPGSLSYNKVRAIHEDRDNNLWIGTDNGGVSFLPNSEKKNYSSGFKSIDVNVGEHDKTVYSFCDITTKGNTEVLIGTSYDYVMQLAKVVNGEVLLEDKKILNEVKNEPFAMITDKNGDVWIGTYGKTGLYRYIRSGDEEKIIRYTADGEKGSLSSDVIRSLLQDSYGNIWIGTDKGLNLLTVAQKDKEKPEFFVFKKDNEKSGSISHNYILPLFQSTDQSIWVGTMGGGLNKVLYNSNPDSIKFKVITVDEGLPNNTIKGIVEDDYGFLWISSNRGLSRYDVRENTFSNFDVNDGLQDYEFGELACCKRSDGEILFGGVNGINAFYPQEIITDMSVPDLVFTDFQILNRSVRSGEKVRGRVVLNSAIDYVDKVVLKYKENSFAIHFSSLHFGAPEKNKYKYMLEGFDQEWVRKEADDRIAKYTNLKAGVYRFKLMASNSDGVWAKEPKILYVEITPPWYLSWLAQIGYVVIIVILLLVFRKYSLIRVKLKNDLLMEHFETEKIKELSQMKLRFFTDISHEFRTPLTLIIGPLERLMHKSEVLSSTKIKESYALMHRNASILLRLMNQLIDFRKYEQGKMKLRVSKTNLVDFLKQLSSAFDELAHTNGIEYRFISSEEDIELYFDRDKMERIMYNLLSNAFKFTRAGGKVMVRVEKENQHTVIMVEDTGIGIPKSMQKNIFNRFYQAETSDKIKGSGAGIGLSFIKGLVEMHKGELSFISEEDKGTTFVLKLKNGSGHFNDDQLVNSNTAIELQDVVSQETISFRSNAEEDEEIKDTKAKVLVVEDNAELSSFIKESLALEYQVFVAENGKIGLDKALELDLDIVISDVMMPEMDGYELCAALKNNENTSHVPIVLLTAKSDAQSRVKGYDVGADGYISKPFSIDVLESRIQNLLKSREQLKEKLRSNIVVEPSEVTTTSMDEKFLQRVLRIVDQNISNPEFTVEQLASDYGLSQAVFHKKLKNITGQTPKVFIRTMRLKRAAKLFALDRYSITDVTYEVGFSDLKYFRNCFKKEFGMLPMEYTKMHRNKKM